MDRSEISTEIKGRVYKGYRVVKGSRAIFQTIYFEDKNRDDDHRYKPGEENTMESIAILILGELVREKYYRDP